MLLEDDSYRLACGKKNQGGLGLSFLSAARSKVTAEFTLKKKSHDYKDIVHGGIIAAIIDEAMINAALTQGGKAITTGIIVKFKNPLFLGEKAVVEAEISKPSRRLTEARAVIKGPGARIIAEGKGKLYFVA